VISVVNLNDLFLFKHALLVNKQCSKDFSIKSNFGFMADIVWCRMLKDQALFSAISNQCTIQRHDSKNMSEL